MSDIDETNTRSRVDTVQQCLEDIKVILENNQHIELDSRGRRTLTQVLSGESYQDQSLIKLQERLDSMHPADIAAMLEQLPLDERLTCRPPCQDRFERSSWMPTKLLTSHPTCRKRL